MKLNVEFLLLFLALFSFECQLVHAQHIHTPHHCASVCSLEPDLQCDSNGYIYLNQCHMDFAVCVYDHFNKFNESCSAKKGEQKTNITDGDDELRSNTTVILPGGTNNNDTIGSNVTETKGSNLTAPDSSRLSTTTTTTTTTTTPTLPYYDRICYNYMTQHCPRLRAVCKRLNSIGKTLITCKDNVIAIQRQTKHDSLDFNKRWRTYETGFGNKGGSYFLGLKNIQYLSTYYGKVGLGIMVDYKGSYYCSSYSYFRISGAPYYKLSVSGYSNPSVYRGVKGTASATAAWDAMKAINGIAFSTWDKDHDSWSGSLVSYYGGGGWWYKDTYNSNLNGDKKTSGKYGLYWAPGGGSLYNFFRAQGSEMWLDFHSSTLYHH